MALDGEWGILGTLFVICGKEKFNLMPHPMGDRGGQVALLPHCHLLVNNRPSLV